MKKFSVFMLFVVICGVAFAQNNENKKSAFQFSFVTPIGTNGLRSCDYTNTASLNLLVGVSRNEKAFTFAGLTNVILNDASGLQFAGISNHVGNEGRGCQFAGLANTNKGTFKGVQFAGILNSASQMSGTQFSGLVNMAKDVKGVQFAGLINIAKDVKGAQFSGLVNIAENSDVPIGLINIIKNGEMGVAVTYDGIGNVVASFRSGGKYTYGILGVGYNHKVNKNELVTEGGFGAHIPVTSWFRINNELKATSIGCDSSNPVLNAGYSLLPAFRIGRHFELFGGASFNYMQTDNVNNSKVFPNHSLWKKYDSNRLQQLYIGYQCGVQYIF